MTFLNRLLPSLKNERGAYMVFFAILIPILFGCAGLAVDLGNGFARHARLQKAADAAVLAASYVYDKQNSAEMYRVAEQYLQANLDNEEDRALSLDEIRKKYDMKIYDRGPQDSTKMEGRLLTLDATEKIGSKFIEFVGIKDFSVDVRATTKVVVSQPSQGNGVFDYAFIGANKVYSQENNWSPDYSLFWSNTGQRIHGKVHANGVIRLNGTYNTADGVRNVLIDPGAFSAGKDLTDYDVWLYSSQVTSWEHNYKKVTPPDEGYYDNDIQVNPNDPNSNWYHFIRIGYDNHTRCGEDVVVANLKKEDLFDIDISMKKDSTDTGNIYKYVNETLRKKYPVGWGENAKYEDQEVYYSTNGNFDKKQAEWINLYQPQMKAHRVIVADGNVTVNEQDIDFTADHVEIISLHGNIQINLSDHLKLKALVYAPQGNITYNGCKEFEGSIVAQRFVSNKNDVTYTWKNFTLGKSDNSSGSGSSGTGGGDSGTESVSSVILHKNKDADYEEPSSQNELRP